MEFSTAKEAKKHAAAKIVKINDHAYETVRLKDMRSLEALLEEVGREPFNSLTPGRCNCDFRYVIFKYILRFHILGISHEIAARQEAMT